MKKYLRHMWSTSSQWAMRNEKCGLTLMTNKKLSYKMRTRGKIFPYGPKIFEKRNFWENTRYSWLVSWPLKWLIYLEKNEFQFAIAILGIGDKFFIALKNHKIYYIQKGESSKKCFEFNMVLGTLYLSQMELWSLWFWYCIFCLI